MTTTLTSIDTAEPRFRGASLTGPLAADVAVGIAFNRATVEGVFMLLDDSPITVDAESGLQIRVQAGCVWVPSCAEGCSVSVCAGERFVVRRGGTLTVLASRGTEIELEWPTPDRASFRLN